MTKKMRESVRRERKIPRFNPIPVDLRKTRGGRRVDYARFYGNFVTKTGKIKRFSFQVRMPRYLNGKVMHRMISLVCQKIRYFNLVPIHKQGQTFPFGELMQGNWIRVRKVRDYQAGMIYER